MSPTLNLITGDLSDGRWICRVCIRSVITGRRPWSSYGCVPCWKANKHIGQLLGGERFLPLGIHSAMNGGGIPVGVGGLQRDAAVDQLVAMIGSWRELDKWRSQETQRLAEAAGIDGDVVTIRRWRKANPASVEAVGSAFLRLIAEHHRWLVGIAPELGDLAWLTNATQDTVEEVDKTRLFRVGQAEAAERAQQEARDEYRRWYEEQVRLRGW